MAHTTTNATVTDLLDAYPVQYWEQILFATLVGLIAITGLIGNSMIILAVAFSKKLHTSTNVFVTSLSVTDLLTSFTLIWYAVSVLGKEEWLIPEAYWVCQATGFNVYAFTMSSLWTLGMININRLLYITKPFWYKKIFKSWKFVILVMIPWVIPFVGFLIPVATGQVAYGYNRAALVCSILEDTTAYRLTLYIVGLFFPLLATIGSYLLIYVYLKKHFRKQRKYTSAFSRNLSTRNVSSGMDNTAVEVTIIENDDTTQEATITEGINMAQDSNVAISASVKKKTQISAQEIKIIKNLFIVVVAFIICFIPWFILQPFRSQALHLNFYTRLLIISNSAVNFIIYASKHPYFKVVLRHLMKRSYSDIPQPSPLLKYLLTSRKN